jgi:hypothetical protein
MTNICWKWMVRKMDLLVVQKGTIHTKDAPLEEFFFFLRLHVTYDVCEVSIEQF